MKFLVLGATGMAGHTISIYLNEQKHDVTTITRRPFKYCNNIVADISDFHFLEKQISNGNYDVIVNCVGILNKTSEDNKEQAVLFNSYLPHFLSKITQKKATRVIHLSTDCVFSGKSGSYNEDSFKDGETFYDRSKALGELVNSKDLTFRCSIIGPDINRDGTGLFNWFMKQEGAISGYSGCIWTGVSTLTLAKAIEQASTDNLVGLYHLVNNTKISKYELLMLFNNYIKCNHLLILKNPNNVSDKSLINNRKDFNFKVPTYEFMIEEMNEWIENHRDMYPHYLKVSKNA
jgi:dTDP-4-dehydrorhamnose reductase